MPETPLIPALIPAAGASGRMGGADKLLLEIEGEPLLRRILRAALAGGAPAFVMLDPARPARAAAISGLKAHVCHVPDAARAGLSASLRAGIAAMRAEHPHAAGALIVLADMPRIGAEDIACLLREARRRPHAPLRAATDDGQPGHPVYLPMRLLARLQEAHGDLGARDLLRAERPRLIPLPRGDARCDIDSPEDWQRFLKRQRQG